MPDIGPQRAKDRIVRFNEVVPRTGLCRRTIYYLIGENKFPEGFKISKRARGWRESQIDQWIAERGVGIEAAS